MSSPLVMILITIHCTGWGAAAEEGDLTSAPFQENSSPATAIMPWSCSGRLLFDQNCKCMISIAGLLSSRSTSTQVYVCTNSSCHLPHWNQRALLIFSECLVLVFCFWFSAYLVLLWPALPPAFPEPSVRLAAIRNCSYQLGSEEAEKRQAHNYRKDIKGRIRDVLWVWWPCRNTCSFYPFFSEMSTLVWHENGTWKCWLKTGEFKSIKTLKEIQLWQLHCTYFYDLVSYFCWVGKHKPIKVV